MQHPTARVYTFILEFDGGTFIRQCSAQGLPDAVGVYLNSLSSGEAIQDVHAGQVLAAEWAGDVPVRIEGMRGVWCLSGICGERSALLHIVGCD